MRNECERSNSSRQSADFRRGSTTPQGQLCESSTLRGTPHSVYKYEPPYLSSLRPRTPHNGIVNMFPSVSPSARCLAPPNGSVIAGILPSQCLSIVHADATQGGKVSVAVQTEKMGRQFMPNVSLARSVTPMLNKTDQTTSTEDLASAPHGSSSEEVDGGAGDERKPPKAARRNAWNKVSTSGASDDCATNLLKRVRDLNPSGVLVNQLGQLEANEREVLRCLDVIDRKERELVKDRRKLMETLRRISNVRLQRISQPQNETLRATSSSGVANGMAMDNSPRHQQEEEHVVSNSSKNFHVEKEYMVSSSQEVSSRRFKNPDYAEFFNNDSPSRSVQGERCTSTSLLERSNSGMFPNSKDSSDSEDGMDIAPDQFGLQAKYRLENPRFVTRDRLNSGSTSENSEEEKRIKEAGKSCPRLDPGKESRSEVDIKDERLIADSHLKREEGKEVLGYDLQEPPPLVKEEHEHICNLTVNRKGSLSGSPQSPKMRNSSGSEHGYSLRSRGPPSELFDFNSDSQLSKDTITSSQEDQLDLNEEKQQPPPPPPQHCLDKQDDEQADDEEEEMEVRTSSSSSRLNSASNDSIKKRKRKRKTKYQMSKSRKKKEIAAIFGNGKDGGRCSPPVDALEDVKTEKKEPEEKEEFIPRQEAFKLPPPHLAAVLDLKVVGNLIFTTSTDRTARLFDPVSGVVLSTYQSHEDSVTAIQVIGEPQFTVGSPGFQVITGSEDHSIHVYDGKTGVLTQKRICSEAVRCLDYRWGYLFIGTDGGCGMKWNLKDKKLGEKIQFCGKGITRLLTHVEGGRKVLVVGAKTTPIMIRDAMSGLFLRTLEYVQLTVYAAVFDGSMLYTGGADKNIYVYDYCGGTVKRQFQAEASISGLILLANYLIATCYDGLIRIFRLPEGDLVHVIPVESSHKMFICSALFRNKILLGNKNGEIVCCELPKLEN